MPTTQIQPSAIDRIKKQVVCPVELALRVLGGKWRGSIIYQLKDGPLRFNQLKYNVQDAVVNYENADNYLSNKVLSIHLNDLLEYGLVAKEEQEPHFIYKLTEKGKSAMPILLDLFYWGENQF